MPVRDAVKCCTVVADGADGLRSGDVVGGIHRYEPLNSQSCKVKVGKRLCGVFVNEHLSEAVGLGFAMSDSLCCPHGWFWSWRPACFRKEFA